MAGSAAFVATFDFRDSSVSFCSLPVVDGQLIDTGEITPLSDFEEDGCDSVIEILKPNELPSNELKLDLEQRLRLRMAHFDLCHPNVPLKEN
jgi:hypothetical protein